MKDKIKYDTSQLFNFTKDSYLERTSRPIYAIIFLLPFIIFYELGTIFINTDVLNQSQIRVVAFLWLQNLLEYLGFTSKLAWMAPPLAVIVILFALQLASRKKWYFALGDFFPMAIECLVYAIPLIVFSLFLNSPAKEQYQQPHLEAGAIRIQAEPVISCSSISSETLSQNPQTDNYTHKTNKPSLLADIVTGIGAGIYEELIFRLILIGVLMIIFQDVFRLSHKNSIILSILISAALFSAHHHIVFLNGRFGQTAAFNWTEFSFRTVAGIYFAILFAIRGFGITAGAHSFYDIIAVFINAVFFEQ